MKIVFFGTSEFAIPALEKLKASDFELAAVVTQPDKPAGRKQELLPSPVKIWAVKNGIKLLQPEKLTPSEIPTADLFIVASYGKIIPQSILDIPKLGALNIHPSLLPKYRGASPIQAAILNGDKETGLSIIKMDAQMDHGDIVASTKFEIRNSRIGFQELHDELAEVAAELLVKTMPQYISGGIKPEPQEHAKATFVKEINKSGARIDWSKTAEEIERMIRAYEVWPVAWTTLKGKRLKINAAAIMSDLSGPPQPRSRSARRAGTLSVSGGGKIIVVCGTGSLELLELQLEGGKKMNSPEFLRGHSGLNGKILV